MSEDIVTRLRHFAKQGGIINKDVFNEAADEIERLREVERRYAPPMQVRKLEIP